MILRLILEKESWSYVLGVNTVLGERSEVAPLVIFTWVKTLLTIAYIPRFHKSVVP